MYNSRIIGMGHYVPENIVTNDDLSKLMDTNDQWIQERTGIRQRRWAVKGDGDTTFSMGLKAAKNAIRNSGIDKQDIDFIVFWKIADAGAYLFNIQDPPETVKVAAQSVMRDIIGQTKIQTALTGGRQEIQLKAKTMLQDLLNEYQAGVEIRDVQLLSVDPPAEVIDAFNDVQRARQDRDTLINEAEAFRNDIVPRARGEAAQLISEAEAYASEVVNRAKGDADRFNSIYKSYQLNPKVTESRIYLETMEKVFSRVKKIIMDKSASSSGVVPYLPLDQLKQKCDK